MRQFPHRKAPGFFLFIDCSRSQKQSFAVVGLTQNPVIQIFYSCLYKANSFSETDSDLSQRRGAFDTTYLAFPEYIHNNSSYKQLKKMCIYKNMTIIEKDIVISAVTFDRDCNS